ncbi:Csu type fimbrial protein [Dyella psychrodurans]|uniref:SCPU domain-containing protein n=1 Tax=Dyella psychrodurans TaxID=1927960 RepID=A0A370X1V7_9GAMM|nr:spore coat U domain-containing protein [Dyella psychrodurans]RDS82378.1 SCPU domain-containing protein [Dyella psychrodurans]
MNKFIWRFGLAAVLLVLSGAPAYTQFTMPPPAEPVDPLPPSIHPLPPHTEPVPAAAECHVDTNVLNFGNYTSGQNRNLDMTMGWSLRCTEPARLLVTVSPSPDSGSFEYRLLRHQGGDNATLRYQLYTEWSRSIPWGDGTGESQPIEVIVQNYSQVEAFGRVFANQNAVPGEYSDDILVTIEVE